MGAPNSEDTDLLLELKRLLEGAPVKERIAGLEQVRVAMFTPGRIKVEKFVDLEILPLLLNAIKEFNYPELQVVAARVLVDIGRHNGEAAAAVIAAGGLKTLMKLFDSKSVDVVEGAFECLSDFCNQNITAVLALRPERKFVLLSETKDTQILMKVSEYVSVMLLTSSAADDQRFAQAIWPLVMKWLRSANSQVAQGACWAIQSANSRSTYAFQALVAAGAVQSLAALLTRSGDEIRCAACLAIRNIAAGSVANIQEVIDKGLIPTLASVIIQADDSDLRENASGALCSVISGASLEQARTIAKPEVIRPLCDFIRAPECGYVIDELTALLKLLTTDQLVFGLVLEACDGWTAILRAIKFLGPCREAHYEAVVQSLLQFAAKAGYPVQPVLGTVARPDQAETLQTEMPADTNQDLRRKVLSLEAQLLESLELFRDYRREVNAGMRETLRRAHRDFSKKLMRQLQVSGGGAAEAVVSGLAGRTRRARIVEAAPYGRDGRGAV